MQKINSSTAYRRELRQRILNTAMTLFREKGVKAVKMDDIANSLSISKRTLYEIFSNKEDLLLETVKTNHEEQESRFMEFAHEHNDVMHIIIEFYKRNFIELGGINPQFFGEIRKYKKVDSYLQQRHENSKGKTLEFFHRGVEDGYFLPQLNYDIVTRLGEAAMDFVMKTKMYEEFPMQEIFSNFVAVLLRGYCTEKGKLILDEAL